MERFYMEKRRDTFHYRGAFKRLGMKFDGEKRVWYAETPEVLAAAYKLLQQEQEPPAHGGKQAEGQSEQQEHKQCGECGYTQGEHSPSCETGKQQQSEEMANDGDMQGQGSGSGGNGDSPKPFSVFTQQGAQAADAALAQLVQGGKQQQQQAQKQQQQMQQAVEKMKQEADAKMEQTRKEVLALAQSAEPKKVEIHINDAPPVQLDGEFVPEVTAEIVALLSIGKHVRLVGPAGTGKSKLAQLAAQVLGRRFSFLNFSEGVDESHLYGFRDITPEGTKYVVPEGCYADMFENGGIWLGDEFDRANTNVVVSLNGSLSEPFLLSLPKRAGATIAKQSPEFGAVFTGNTWGTGPTSAYTSANRLDASSLDRVRIATIYVDYNRKLEAALLPDGDLLRKIWDVRDKVMSLGMQRVVSTRFVKDAADVTHKLGWTHDKVMKQLVQDWSATDKQKVGLAHF